MWRSLNISCYNYLPNSAAAARPQWQSRSLTKGSSYMITPRRIMSARIISAKLANKAAAAVSPWLMLPPSLDGTDLVYDFYGLGKDKVFSFNKLKSPYYDDELPEDGADFVGSSHGWIASYSNYSEKDDLFLSDPISQRHIKLPSLSPLNLPFHCIDNVVISSPHPDHDPNCRAVLRYEGNLAFCCPSYSSNNWTPFGHKGDYCSAVYSTSQNIFFCLTQQDGIEAWDLNNLRSPLMIPMKDVSLEAWDHLPLDKQYISDAAASNLFYQVTTSLAVAEDDLYQVRRYTAAYLCPDGSHAELIMDFDIDHMRIDPFPYKTTDFDVYKYDKGSRAWKYMNRTLNGMSLFLGINHGFALSAADYPGLKPNAIYFTDIERHPDLYPNFGGHDMGIFNYSNKTLSPCYYPCDYHSIKQVYPPPFWFTPNLRD